MGTMEVEYRPDHAVVTLVSDIRDETVIELAATMRHLRRDCFYEWAHLEIASAGGAETALNHWLAEADGLRRDGLRIVTRGLTSVGSAAAVMLSLGDVRETRRNTRLLYHCVRIAGSGALTADEAGHQADQMNRIDRDVRDRLAARALKTTQAALPAWDMAFEDRIVAEHLPSRVDWPGRDEPVTNGGKAGDASLSRLRKLVAWCGEGPKERFAALYERLLRLDQPISAALAMELSLIDRIADGCGNAQSERAKSPFRVPQWSALFPSGEVARDSLCRHVLVLGEPGSGKTASAILPAVAAACDPANRVGNQTLGEKCVWAVRYDIDENGSGVVDVFASPHHVYKIGRAKVAKDRIACTSALNRVAKEFKRTHSYSALQDSWTRFAQKRGWKVERGKLKEVTEREHLSPEDYKATRANNLRLAADALELAARIQETERDAKMLREAAQLRKDAQGALDMLPEAVKRLEGQFPQHAHTPQKAQSQSHGRE